MVPFVRSFQLEFFYIFGGDVKPAFFCTSSVELLYCTIL